MALSVIVIPGDGVTTQFAIPFSLGYLSENDVTCRVGNEVDGTGAPVYRSLTFLSEETVIVSGPPAGVNVPVRFERTVPRDVLLVDYEDDAVINEDNMNTSQLQLIMLVQEIADGRFDQFQTNVDMAGNRFTNMGNPVNAQDGATKSYVDASYGSNAANLALTLAARDAAIDARIQADTAAGVSATQAGLASASTSAAVVSEANALAYRNSAQTHRDNAFKWASEQENVQVYDGVRTGFSAYHWAQKAAQSIGGVSSWAGLTGSISKLQASTALTDVFVSLDGSVQMTGKLQLMASIAGSAALNIPNASTPTSPQNGDIWMTNQGLYYRVNGTVRQSYDAGSLALPSQSEAESGTSTTARSWSAQRVAQAIAAKDFMPVGAVLMLYGNDSVAPDGYLLANGAPVTSAYPALRAHGLARGWAVNGTGDPLLPDFGGYFPRGWRTGQIIDSNRVFGTVQSDDIKSHTHVPTGLVTGGSISNNNGATRFYSDTAFVANYGSIPATQASGGAETRPANVTVTYWIKAFSSGQTSGTADLTQLANTVSDVQARVPKLEGVQTLDQNLVHGSSGSAAHGLGVTPSKITCSLVCSIANNGYAVGDTIECGSNGIPWSGQGAYGLVYWADNNNVFWQVGATGIVILTKPTGGTVGSVAANWKLRFKVAR